MRGVDLAMTNLNTLHTRLIASVISVVAVSGCNPPDKRPEAQPQIAGPSPASPAASPPALVAKSETRQFKDWRASCGNDGACWAFGFAPELEAGWVRIAIQPGPQAEPQVTFGYWPDGGSSSADDICLDIDGVKYPGAPTNDSDTDQPISNVQNRGAAINAMVRGRSMAIHGSSVRTISLSGAAAAMLWIDEKQQRLGTQAALVRRGDRPASDVPSAPVLPVISVAPAIDQSGMGAEGRPLPATLQALPEVRTCLEESVQPDVSKTGRAFRLNAETELYAVPCGSGAYNLTHNWYLAGRGGLNPRPVALRGTADTGADPAWSDNATVNGEYDPTTRKLTAFARGRGIGDCGTIQSWAWTGDRFALTEERSMGDCAGVPADLWPVTWKTR